MRILYIEDSPDLALIVLDVLKAVGHEIVWIDDRTKHPQDLSPFDFVLSDFHVPGGEFKTTKILCEEQRKPLLLMSGGLDAEISQHHEHWMTKPFDKNVLIQRINELSQRGA